MLLIKLMMKYTCAGDRHILHQDKLCKTTLNIRMITEIGRGAQKLRERKSHFHLEDA